ncbi:MAG: hypothetical protein ACKOBM_02725 [Gammaproteobacteria bacterium]
MALICAVLWSALGAAAAANIPATPVMTLYRFNGNLNLPYFDIESFATRGPVAPAGTLAQGTTLVPCLVLRNGMPLTDAAGTPWVGFEVVVDARSATPASAAAVRSAIDRQRSARVAHHHCGPNVRHVLDVRNLYVMDKVPFFDPPRSSTSGSPPADAGVTPADRVVRAFHDSPECGAANAQLIGRRAALARAWAAFEQRTRGQWSAELLTRARHLDYTLRTALYEGHLERGCSAYGACERNVVALSIRNRAVERCFAREGCTARGDITGVASKPAQYNIWDEYLTQISGLTACYLRPDLAGQGDYDRLQAMYAQSVPDVEQILFGTAAELSTRFPGVPVDAVRKTAHYYHAPAMGKCFPGHPRVEYMSGAVARRGNDHALIANQRIEVGAEVDAGYRFQIFRFTEGEVRDEVEVRDDYPNFVVDRRKVALSGGGGCRPYGVPAGCAFAEVGRHRRVPHWLDAGTPIGLSCRIETRGESCAAPPRFELVEVGGQCDTQMRPVSGVH